jgi:hypothetical protein
MAAIMPQLLSNTGPQSAILLDWRNLGGTCHVDGVIEDFDVAKTREGELPSSIDWMPVLAQRGRPVTTLTAPDTRVHLRKRLRIE